MNPENAGAIESQIPSLRRYARALSGSADRADDLVQDCLERAVARFEQFEPGTEMIEDGRYCVDVARQIEAVIAALRRVQGDMLRDHLRALVEATVMGDLPEAERRRLADEVADLTTKVI
jgi:DNA-binding FrmR family transcriptional regulator